MRRHLVREVFTPTTPARVTFVERESANDRLVNALSTPGKQLVVYGHSGTGKTTLVVNKLAQLYESNITTRCMKGMTFDQLILDAFDQLAPFYTAEKSKSRESRAVGELAASYLALKATLASYNNDMSLEKQARVLPPQLTPQALGRLLGAARTCWVLEDFHKIGGDAKERLAQLMKVFMDLADEYPLLRIIALGAVGTARQVVDYDPEMRNRVAEIHVPLMTPEEVGAVIAKGEGALNIRITQDVKSQVVKHSNGLASVCHQLCLSMCDAAGVVESRPGTGERLTKAHLERAVKTYVEEASDTIKSAFDKALRARKKTRYANAEIALRALSSLGDAGGSRADIFQRARAIMPEYPENNLRYMLTKLATPAYGELVRYDPASGRYAFSEPIYRAFALAQFPPAETTAERVSALHHELDVLLSRLLTEMAPRRRDPGRRSRP